MASELRPLHGMHCIYHTVFFLQEMTQLKEEKNEPISTVLR